jgi:hypothetical protein
MIENIICENRKYQRHGGVIEEGEIAKAKSVAISAAGGGSGGIGAAAM